MLLSGSDPIHPTSPPEQNAVPCPVTTTTRTVRSDRSFAIVCGQISVSSPVIALRRSGTARVSRATPSAGRSIRNEEEEEEEEETVTRAPGRVRAGSPVEPG